MAGVSFMNKVFCEALYVSFVQKKPFPECLALHGKSNAVEIDAEDPDDDDLEQTSASTEILKFDSVRCGCARVFRIAFYRCLLEIAMEANGKLQFDSQVDNALDRAKTYFNRYCKMWNMESLQSSSMEAKLRYTATTSWKKRIVEVTKKEGQATQPSTDFSQSMCGVQANARRDAWKSYLTSQFCSLKGKAEDKSSLSKFASVDTAIGAKRAIDVASKVDSKRAKVLEREAVVLCEESSDDGDLPPAQLHPRVAKTLENIDAVIAETKGMMEKAKEFQDTFMDFMRSMNSQRHAPSGYSQPSFHSPYPVPFISQGNFYNTPPTITFSEQTDRSG